MPQYKRDLTRMTFPKLPNQAAVRDYVESKLVDEVVKKYPESDLPRISPKIELTRAKRGLEDIEDRLQQKREGAVQRRADMDKQWKDLAQKEELLKKSFITFNKFVKENHDKRERAEKTTEEEIAIQKILNEKITEMQQKYDEMRDVKRSIEKYIKSYRLYEHYLRSVVRAHPEFKTINDLLNRYEALGEARIKLLDRQEFDLSELEQARMEMIKTSEEKTLHIMGLNNQLSILESRYETAYNKACYWNTNIARVQSIAGERIKDLHLVKEACWDIYLQMCKRKQIRPEFKKDDLENQFMFIKKTLVELRYIVKTAQKHAKDANSGYVQGTSVFSKK